MDRRRAPAARLAGCLVLLLGLPAGLGACASEPAGAWADLEGRTFASTDVVGHDLVEGTRVRIVFQSDRISVQAGCNTLNGAATWDGDVLVVAEPLAQTMMACDRDLMRQDDWLVALLTSEPQLRLDGTTLVLGDDAEGVTLVEQ